MSDISLDYEGSSRSSRSSSRENQKRTSRSKSEGKDDKPMWKSKRSYSIQREVRLRNGRESRFVLRVLPRHEDVTLREDAANLRVVVVVHLLSEKEDVLEHDLLLEDVLEHDHLPEDVHQRHERNGSPMRRRNGSRDRTPPRRNYRRQRSGSKSPENWRDAEEKRKDAMWISRREERVGIQADGLISVWGHSPTQEEIHDTYKLRVEADEIEAENEKKGEQLKEDRRKARKREMRAVRNVSEDDSSTSSESEDSGKEEERKKKVKKTKKNKKEKKKDKKSKKAKKEKEERRARREQRKKERAEIKRKINNRSDTEDEWEEKKPEKVSGTIGTWKEGSMSPTPILPDHIKQRDQGSAFFDVEKPGNYGKDLLKGEGAGMAAYAARGERIPRRGEIGLSSGEIAEYEKVGYVMSGSRHKAMEATRLRKENQILTAEEKRLLSGVSFEAKKKKEEAQLEQLRSLIRNKNMRN
ncbi:unnamed protein product [Caenorhabditis sp. 36 PRJEB53466]|nr:unnamed protein product [Caenorhabditis sp. 36 PRJEB53466]